MYFSKSFIFSIWYQIYLFCYYKKCIVRHSGWSMWGIAGLLLPLSRYYPSVRGVGIDTNEV